MEYDPVFVPDPVRAGMCHMVAAVRREPLNRYSAAALRFVKPSLREWERVTVHWPLDGVTTERTIRNTMRLALDGGRFYALRYYALPIGDLDTVAPTC